MCNSQSLLFWKNSFLASLPEEFLENAPAAAGNLAYMSCITEFKLNAVGAIPNADATFDSFEFITERQTTTWREFA